MLTEITGTDLRTLVEGDKVAFDLVQGQNGSAAENFEKVVE